MVVRCQRLLSASTDRSQLYNYSGIDLLLPFWYVCTGALTCIQPPPLPFSVHSVKFVLKIQLALGSAGHTPLLSSILVAQQCVFLYVPKACQGSFLIRRIFVKLIFTPEQNYFFQLNDHDEIIANI